MFVKSKSRCRVWVVFEAEWKTCVWKRSIPTRALVSRIREWSVPGHPVALIERDLPCKVQGAFQHTLAPDDPLNLRFG